MLDCKVSKRTSRKNVILSLNSCVVSVEKNVINCQTKTTDEVENT